MLISFQGNAKARMPSCTQLGSIANCFSSLLSFSLSIPILPPSLLLGLTLSPCLFDLPSLSTYSFLMESKMFSTLTSLRPWNKVKFPCHLMNDNSKFSCQVPKRSCFYTIPNHHPPSPTTSMSPGLKARVNLKRLHLPLDTLALCHCGCPWCSFTVVTAQPRRQNCSVMRLGPRPIQALLCQIAAGGCVRRCCQQRPLPQSPLSLSLPSPTAESRLLDTLPTLFPGQASPQAPLGFICPLDSLNPSWDMV